VVHARKEEEEEEEEYLLSSMMSCDGPCANSSLYWSDLGAVAKIERSRLDGTDRQIFIRQDLDKPLGLSVDYAAGRLYWVDDFRDTIESVDLVTGDNRRRLYVTRDVAARPKLFALSIFEVGDAPRFALRPRFCQGNHL